ncbi:hypothetical protein [Oceanobacillus bengalensis]|uniref:Secreted protein n=1 Tax=Oceanobacillus bengalensis TaxID=1435466 RepID=A0A494YV14_9BACI|nr:hypothetical protein [Oceanobacillus bengalensis]RKQ14017.1 hypothetical protein D8M05_14215 [Oceanobacillus bengalensis]
MEQHHQHHESTIPNQNFHNEINVSLTYRDNIVEIHLENNDDINNPIELVENHEKYMHLIIVSNDLEEYYHLHPKKIKDNHFEAKVKLSDRGSYKGFVDIIVEGKDYVIEPISIGRNHANESIMRLKPDSENEKEIKGYQIILEHGHFATNEKVELKFNLKNANPDPYLGALGHVVILDELAERFIHVHPVSNNKTIFETHFDIAGKYKLWAEFKIGQDIITFPYVFEVIESHY